MPTEYESAGSEISLEQLTVEDFMAVTLKAVRPNWMVTRYSVDLDEFDKLNKDAEQLDEQDWPEEDIFAEHLGPSEQASSIRTSFEDIPATSWQPPDNTSAVEPNDVILSVNTELAIYQKNGTLLARLPSMATFSDMYYLPELAFLTQKLPTTIIQSAGQFKTKR